MKKAFLIILILKVGITTTFAQSGWTKEKDNFFIKLDYQFYNSTDFNNLNGTAIQTDEFRQKTFLLYGEYGLSNKFSFNAYLPLIRFNAYQNTETVSGIGDLKLELKYALSKGKLPIALSIAPELPTGPKNLFAKSKINSFDEINLPTGDGEFNVWTTAAISHSFYPKPIYISAFTSFNYRTSFGNRDFQNQLLSGVEGGYKFFGKLWLSGKLSVLNGLGAKPQFADFIRGDGTTYTGLSVNSAYQVGKHYAINFQYFKPTSFVVNSRNNYDANTFSIGVSYSKK